MVCVIVVAVEIVNGQLVIAQDYSNLGLKQGMVVDQNGIITQNGTIMGRMTSLKVVTYNGVTGTIEVDQNNIIVNSSILGLTVGQDYAAVTGISEVIYTANVPVSVVYGGFVYDNAYIVSPTQVIIPGINQGQPVPYTTTAANGQAEIVRIVTLSNNNNYFVDSSGRMYTSDGSLTNMKIDQFGIVRKCQRYCYYRFDCDTG